MGRAIYLFCEEQASDKMFNLNNNNLIPMDTLMRIKIQQKEYSTQDTEDGDFQRECGVDPNNRWNPARSGCLYFSFYKR